MSRDEDEPTTVTGLLTRDTQWSGAILVTGDLIVPPGVTLTILPGTRVLFAHHRGPGTGLEAGCLDIRGGRLLARGLATAPVWFTSDAPEPRPGDWRYLQLRDGCPHAESEVSCAIVEFARLGILVWSAAPRITDVFVRQCTWEGLYAESHASPTFARVISRDNGYNGIALEQFNRVTIRDAVLAGNGTHGLHCDRSRATIERSRIEHNRGHGLSVDNGSLLRVHACDVVDNAVHGVGLDAGHPRAVVTGSLVARNGSAGINCREHGSLVARGNRVESNRPIQLHCHSPLGTLDVRGNWWGAADTPYLERELTGEAAPGAPPAFFHPAWAPVLPHPPVLPERAPRVAVARALERLARARVEPGYRPSEAGRDPVAYVGADDATRRITRRIGAGIGLPWSVTWDGSAVWTATLDTNQLLRLDPISGEVLARFPTPGPQSWGLAFDGEALWLADFAELAIRRLDPATGEVLARYPSPDPLGGVKGLTWTGELLAVLGWRSHAIYLLDRRGRLKATLPCPLLKGGLAYDGQWFWGPCRDLILAVDAAGRPQAAITAASDGTWDLEWAEGVLWATQRTNENWADAKIYALEPRDVLAIDLDPLRARLAMLNQLARRARV